MSGPAFRLVITEHLEDGTSREIPHRAVRTLPACKALYTNYLSVVSDRNAMLQRTGLPMIQKVTSRIEEAIWTTVQELPEQLVYL